MKKISLIISSIAIIFAITLSILPVNLNYNSVKLDTFLTKAIAEGEETAKLNWSDPLNCGDGCSGTYCYCSTSGSGNSCSKHLDTTCTCCVNC